MDGFEDNRGIVVLGATNRPGAIDSALVRPGRFDRIIYMPLPDAMGRAQILKVTSNDLISLVLIRPMTLLLCAYWNARIVSG